jgi:hypothetical protein
MSNENTDSGLHMLRAVMAAIILANLVSIYGQVQWFAHDQHLPLIGAIGAAVSLESIALALSAMAHHAMVAGDSSWTLAGGSRGMSIVAGLINLSHYSPHGITHPSTLGIVFGLLSSSSGFMWGALARRIARDKFIEQGVIEKRTVKVGMALWVLHTGEAFDRLRTGVYYGENRLSEVRTLVEAKRAARNAASEAERIAAEAAAAAAAEAERQAADEAAKPEREASTARLELEAATTKADRVRVALRHAPEGEASTYVAWLTEHGVTNVNAGYVRQIRASDREREATSQRSTLRAIGAGSA